MNRFCITAGAILILFMSAAFSRNAGAQFFMFDNPLVGKETPDFNAPTLLGGVQNMSTFRNGNKAIIFFWATWCPHCRKQLSELNKISKELEKEGISVVLVDVGEAADQVKSFMTSNKIGFDVFLDQQQSIAEEYGIIGVPTFYFVNKDGIIKAVEHEIPKDYKAILNG